MAGIYETFGKYKLTERLAFGGMAEVFLATVHGEAGFVKPVVIKRLHPRLSEDSDFVQMLIDEARITAQLIHGNICQVLDLGSVDGSYYIAMEFISGEDARTLQDHCNRRRISLPIDAAGYIIGELLAGLDYAHRKEGPDGKPLGIIHRDISPQNVLISYEGEVKIIDFGIAKARMRLVHTQQGVIKGKFRYMAPEQASGEVLDQRTDIFAVGVVLYELLRGGPHSLELPDTEVLRRMRRAEFEPLRRQRPDLPRSLEKLVLKALARRPRDRFATANQFRSELLHVMQQLGPGYGRTDLAELMQQVFDAERRRRRSGSLSGTMEQVRLESGEPLVPTIGHQSGGAARAPHDSTSLLPGQGPEPKAGWVSFAATIESDPGRMVSEPGAVDALDLSATSSLDRGPPLDPDDNFPTEAYYTLGEDEVELESGRMRTAAMDRSDRPSPARRPDAHRQAASVKPARQDLHRQRTARTVVAPEHAVTGVLERDDASASAPASGSGSGSTGDGGATVPDRVPMGSRFGPEGQPTTRTELVAQQQTVPGDRRPPTRPSPALRMAIGVALVAVLGAGLGLALYLLERPPPEVPRSPDAWLGSQLGRLDGGLDQARAVAPRRGAALLRVRSKPPGARVILCGKDTFRSTPAAITTEANKTCTLELLLDGFETYRASVAAPITIVATLRRRTSTAQGSTAPRGRQGTLLVTSIQVGTVYVNGQAVGRTPQLSLQLAPGSYTVRVHFPALEVRTAPRQVTIRVGHTTRLHLDPSS